MIDNIMNEIKCINNIKRMKNKKKLHFLLDKYGSLENFRHSRAFVSRNKNQTPRNNIVARGSNLASFF